MLKHNSKDREYVILHFGMCWNSLSTASWRPLEEDWSLKMYTKPALGGISPEAFAICKAYACAYPNHYLFLLGCFINILKTIAMKDKHQKNKQQNYAC